MQLSSESMQAADAGARASIDHACSAPRAWSADDQVDHRSLALTSQEGRALIQSEEQYRSLFASVPRPMWVVDAESLKFLAVNDAAILHYGYSRKEFESMSAREVICEQPFPVAGADLMGLSQTGSGTKVLRHRKKNGTVIDVEVEGHPI